MKHIGNIGPARLSFYKANTFAPVELRDLLLGEIASEGIAEDACKPLVELLNASGYAIRVNPQWDEPTLNAVKGSIAPHRDHGLGLVAFWLLHKQPFDKIKETQGMNWQVDDPWLFSNQRRAVLKRGDVVIFDANETHSWMCNGGVYAISQSVSRKRNHGLLRSQS
jgi:hypothetical protein